MDLDFKNMQCYKYTQDKSFQYYFKENEPCRLYCQSKIKSIYKLVRNQVDDGTPCNTIDDETKRICLQGVCRSVGCDWRLDSLKTIDFCGQCDGQNSSCNIYNGLIQFSTKFKTGSYEPIMIIPMGAINIKITESNSFNYLAIRDLNGFYYLNGHLNANYGRYEFNDVNLIFDYYYSTLENNNNYEIIQFHKGLNIRKDIYIMLLNYESKSNITYEYALPNNYKLNMKNFNYKWILNDEWTSCSKSCGKGYKQQISVCFETSLKLIVDDSFCDNNNNNTIAIINNQPCNVFECEPKWFIGEWQECSANCLDGGSGLGIMKRSVLCVYEKPNDLNDDLEIIAILDSECDLNQRPISYKTCFSKCDSYDYDHYKYWIAEEWTNTCEYDLCSVETRVVKCNSIYAICDVFKRPISERKCKLPFNTTCGKWTTTKWSNVRYFINIILFYRQNLFFGEKKSRF
jgi:hypothetical protein